MNGQSNRRSTSRLSLCWLAAFALGLAAGCGAASDSEPTAAVSGKVTVGANPLTDGRVNFVSVQSGVGAGGDLKPDGTYSLDGPLPLGEYKVFITFDISPAQRGTPAEDVLKTVPPKYLSQNTSGLTAKIETGEPQKDFELN